LGTTSHRTRVSEKVTQRMPEKGLVPLDSAQIGKAIVFRQSDALIHCMGV
jgi:hypothetical protein